MKRPDPFTAPASPDDDVSFAARMATARRTAGDGSAPSRPESAIVAEILEWLNDQPQCFARKVHQTAVTGGGEPDIDACLRGRTIKIEIKRPGAPEPGPRQLQRLRRWQNAGALVGWATSLPDVVDIVAHLDDHAWINPMTGPGAPVEPSG
ncbi:MAG: hypothetical protein H7Y15_05350 [Pseudonocardia sp.]|nr:hypothetical protein [Pseudonocardia sp.]